jgi:2'-5' RNA ligase
VQVGDRLICIFIEPVQPGLRFVEWPLHITLIPWFRAKLSSDELAEAIRQKLQAVNSFTLTVSEDAHFGYRGQKIVSLIQLPSPLEAIALKLRQILKTQKAWLVDESTKAVFSFRPHITVQGNKRLSKGDSFMCHMVAIVEQKGDYKEVVAEVELKNG